MTVIDIEIKKQTYLHYGLSIYQMKGLLLLMRIYHVSESSNGIFQLKNGKKYMFHQLMDTRIFRLYILGTCMGAILMQRKILPLHGSVIAIDGKAYAIVGDSGAGKSTLASAFLKRGYQLLTDDVIAVSFSEDRHSVCDTILSAAETMVGKLRPFWNGIN